MLAGAFLAGAAALGAAAADSGARASPETSAAAATTAQLATGKALFDVRCGICHASGGTGAFMLGRRLGAERALLAERSDLTAELVSHAVRRGINSMPVFTRVELTDVELAQVVGYLTRRAAGP
jgi:mono/diheme cytochrome c family protein